MDAPRDDDPDDVHLPDIHDEGYRRALRERGPPRGKHVRPDDGAPHPPHLEATVAMAEAMTDLREWRRDRDREREDNNPAPPTPPPPSGLGLRFDWTMTLGHMLTIIAAIGSGFGVWLTIHDELNKGTVDRAEIHREVDAIRTDIAAVRPKVLSDIEAQNKINQTQDNRIENLADSMRQGRDAASAIQAAVAKLMEAVSTMHEDLSLLKDRLGRNGHSEVPQPERDALAQPPPPHLR